MNTLTAPNLDVNSAVLRLTGLLSDAGFQVTRSFDLQDARAELRAPEECPCPNHGTAICNCQYVVLLVNSPGKVPSSLVIHGHDDRTLISLERREDRALPEGLEETIRRMVSDMVDAPQSQRTQTES
jgi:hypothetical protein